MAIGINKLYVGLPRLWLKRGREAARARIDAIQDLSIRLDPDSSGFLVTFADLADPEQLHHQLLAAPLAGGAPRQYCANAGRVQGASWSPDGKSIAFPGNTQNAIDQFPGALYVCDGPDSPPKNLIADAPFSVVSFRWHPDSKSFLVVIAEGAHRALARLYTNGRVERYTRPPFEVVSHSPYSVSRGDGRVACVLATASQPPDVWLIDNAGRRQRVSQLNPELEKRLYGETEEAQREANSPLTSEIPVNQVNQRNRRPNQRISAGG